MKLAINMRGFRKNNNTEMQRRGGGDLSKGEANRQAD